MKHVWILNHYANPPAYPGGARHHSLAMNLPDHGWRATVIVSSVIHHANRQLLPEGVRSAVETVDGVPYLRLRIPRYEGNSSGRLMSMAAYCARALDPRCRRDIDPPDLVVGSSVHPFAALTGSMLARRFGVPFIFEVRDLWPETLIARGKMAENGMPARVFRALERYLYRRAAYTVTVLPKAHEYIARYGIPEERVVFIANGFNGADFEDMPPRKRKKSFDFVYFGSHGLSNDLDVLLKAFHGFEQEYAGKRLVRLRMIGDGPLKPDLMKMAEELGIRNVSFEPLRPRSEVPALASEADACVVVVGDVERLYRYGIALNKLFDYMGAGRPVISAAAAVNDPVAEAGAGLSVPPDPDSLKKALLEMVDMPPARRAAMARAGRRYMLENHDYRVLAGRFAELLDRTVAEQRSR